MTSIKRVLYTFGMVIGWAIFGWQFYLCIKSILFEHIEFISPLPIGLSLFGILVFLGIQILNWCQMLTSLGQKLDWLEASRGYFLSFISRYIPGAVWGYISRSEWAYREFRIPYHLSNTASIMEILIYLTSAFIILGLIGIIDPNIEKGGWLIGAFSIPFLIWLILERVKKRGLTRFSYLKPLNSILKVRLKSWLMCIFISVIQWLIYGFCIWLIIYAMKGNNTSSSNALDILKCTFAFTLAWTTGFLIPFLPGGLGARETILALFLAIFFNLDQNTGSFVAVSTRLLGYSAEFGWILWGLYRPRSKRTANTP
jgi:glycosyltransferase 2 family protein